jgi:hypothetical protein
MRKTAILPKLILWKQLSTELCLHFKVGHEALTPLVQTVLEVASEGQSQGMRRAQPAAPSPKKKGHHKKSAKTPKVKAAKFGGLQFKDRLAAVMKPGEVVTRKQILERLVVKEWMPSSNDPIAYIGLTLTTNKDMFANDPKKGRGFYILKAQKKSAAVKANGVKPSVIITAADISASVDLQKVMDALIAAPVSYEKNFSITPLAKLADVTTDAARQGLTALRGHGAVAKTGSNTWRLKDRQILQASKTAFSHKSKAMNGASHAAS